VRPGSPAEKAGLRRGDVVTEVGATRIVGVQDLVVALRAHRPGDEVDVAYVRDGAPRKVKVRLEERR
jgi:putative serine protease PepD